ncbi:MAG: hypothetical protein NW202_13060 [Nitrospira sp.]|nr:hypothetical protein [Nitrospira sp.]
MSGVLGQRSSKQVNLARGYRRNVLSDLDGRFKPVREAKMRFQQLVADLGGLSELSHQRQSLLWRFVFLEGWIMEQERRMLLGQQVDEQKWLSALSGFNTLLGRIGLERKARVISPLDALRARTPAGPSTSSGLVPVAAPPADAAGEPTIIEVTGEHAS